MLDLIPATVRLMETVAVVSILPWFTIVVSALLMRQLRWFGFGGKYDG
jgi:antibiotic biosynthesis monooxygenase (ABM) superfamily enzyme